MTKMSSQFMCILLCSWTIGNHILQICCDFPSNGLCSAENSTLCNCTCSTPYRGIRLVDCRSQDRETVPLNFPKETSKIDLQNNSISTIKTRAFDGLLQLRYLYLSDNAIVTIQKGTFGGVLNLRSLYLSSNAIVTIQKGAFDGLVKLRSLDLSNNAIENIQNGAFGELSQLSRLDLSSNTIESVENGTFDGLHSLSRLFLNKNAIKTIENEVFGGFFKLNHLDLSNNAIKTIENGAFDDLLKLYFLDLSNNVIEKIYNGTFDRCFVLTRLLLSSNLLRTIDSYYFLHLARLKYIKLDNNRLESVKWDAFFTLPTIRGINMENNDLLCGCETRKLVEWLRISKVVPDATCLAIGAEYTNKSKEEDALLKCASISQKNTMFPQTQICRSCTNATSSRECQQTGGELSCPGLTCYSRYIYSKDVLEIQKSCETYENCIQQSRNTNPYGCYKSTGDLQCHFCCSGHLCNEGDIGNLLKTLNFKVTFLLDAEMIPAYNSPSSIEFQTFETDVQGQLAKELKKNLSFGTYRIHLLSLSEPNVTARIFVKCTTIFRTKAETVYDYVHNTIKSTNTLKLGPENPSILKYRVTRIKSDICLFQNVTTKKGTYYWPSTIIGSVAQTDCLVPISGEFANRYCDSVNGRANWSEVDDSDCFNTTSMSSNTSKMTTGLTIPVSMPIAVDDNVTASLLKLINKTITDENAESITTELETLSQKSLLFSPMDVNLTVSMLEKLVKFKSNTSQPAQDANIARIMSNVQETPTDILSESQQQFMTLTRFLGTVQKFEDGVNLEDGYFSEVNTNCALFAFKISENDFMGLAVETDLLPGQRLDASRITVVTDDLYTRSFDGSAIIIPSTLTKELNDTSLLSRITITVFRSGKIFSAISKLNSMYNKQTPYVKAPNSLILSASIPNVEVKDLKNPIALRFIHKTQNAFNPQCSFWDVNNTWSTTGCYVNETVKGTYTMCICNHFTNFALVMDIYGMGGSMIGLHKHALSIISYTGCGISFLALILTIVCYLITRKLRSTNPSKLLINLSIALAVTNVIFIVGQQSYAFENVVVCKVVGILMHYFLLSALTWMAIEAFFIYLALVKVFNIYVSHFLLKNCSIGWGIPLVIIAVTVGINGSDNYGLQAGDICWLTTNAFYGAFLGPVALIIIWNFSFFVLVTRALWSGTSSQLLRKSDRDEMSARLRRIISVFVLFGITWTFAIFAINRGWLVFQYLFTIFNSLQGFFVFVFYCLLNKEMKNTWKRIISCCRFADDRTMSQSTKETDAAKPAGIISVPSEAK